MARPLKSGIDYFPLDVRLDTKFELIEAEFGVSGFAIVVKLYQQIYGGFGYYCEWTNEVALLFSRSVGLGGNVVSEILEASIKRGIFNKDMFDKYGILTSEGIQKRYFEAVAKRKFVNVKNEYLLIKVAQNSEKEVENPINSDYNPENSVHNTQIKGNKSKVNKIKLEYSRTAAPPTLHEIKTFCSEKGYIIDPEYFFEYYSLSDWKDRNGKPIENWKKKAILWNKSEKEKAESKENIPDIFKRMGV